MPPAFFTSGGNIVAHTLVYVSDDSVNAIFRCSTCGEEIQFNLPGIGEPSAVPSGDTYTTPDNPDQWMSPCTN